VLEKVGLEKEFSAFTSLGNEKGLAGSLIFLSAKYLISLH
jgi:hypothetical protein